MIDSGTSRPADPVAALTDGTDRIEQLCDALAAVEMRLRSHPGFSDGLTKEMLRQRAATEDILEKLNAIRREISTVERRSDEAKQAADRFDRMERFVGRLEQALRLYDQADHSSELRQEIAALKEQVVTLQSSVSEADIKRRLRNALDRVEAIAVRLIPDLDAEWPDAPIKLLVDELTLKVLRGTREDFLWEIGSGANWLAYHLSILLALQRFFLSETHHPVPGLLIFDQPSQVYFPKRLAHADEREEFELRDVDEIAVRKIFLLLGKEVRAAKGRLQVIVLDHAGDTVWGDLPDVNLTEEWRGQALVPANWLQA